jgi:PBP1b-binding outer membrane lipoprotein LpoB
MKRISKYWPILLLAMSMTSCMTVKAYQKMYLNDTEMELANKKSEVFETNFETYREGASGANGGKVGGGCGCN